MEENFCKVVFPLDHADWHGRAKEELWAVPVSDDIDGTQFSIRSIPFFTTAVSKMDVVRAVRDGGTSAPVFEGLDRTNGHSTYMVLVEPDEVGADKYLRALVAANCGLEATNIRVSLGERILFSIDVPPEVDICEVYGILEDAEKASVWMFQEGRVGHSLKSRRIGQP